VPRRINGGKSLENVRNEKILGCGSVASHRFWEEQMIAYGRLIDTWVEISTLSETNNAQFFSELELYRKSSSEVDR
jgi:hypothetical protein